jgi:hypothetical protein
MIRSNNSCRRQMIAFCIFSFIWNLVSGQGKTDITVRQLKNIRLTKTSVINQISSFISPPLVYYFTNDEWDTKSRILKIYCTNINNSSTDSFEVDIPNKIEVDFPEITISDNFLILLDDYNFNYHRFEKKNGKYIYQNTIELPPHSAGKNMKVLAGDNFLFYSIYNFHPDKQMNNTSLMIYSAKKNQILSFIHPFVPCIGFSHLINDWIAINNNRIALADPCGYKIRLYDFNLILQDSIVFKNAAWNELSNNKIPFETDPSKIHPKLLIDKLLVLQDTISRIEKIEFISDSKLLVSSTCKTCGKNKRRIDIWNIGKWKTPVYSTNFPIGYSESDSIYPNNIPLEINSTSNILFKDNFIYSVIDEDISIKQSMTFKEFNQQKDLYYETNDPYFTIAVYGISTP